MTVISNKIRRAFFQGSEKGFTLVEVMVALTLIALVFIPLISLRNLNVRQTAYARQALRATFLAHEKLSALQLDPGSLAPGEISGDFGETHPGFKWFGRIKETPFAPILEIDLRAAWGSGNHEEGIDWIEYVRVPGK